MTTLIEVTQGDSDDRTLSLTDDETGNPVDLTGMSSAAAKFRKKGTTTTLASIVCTLVLPATLGKLTMPWGATLAGRDPGYYEIEVSVVIPGPKTKTAKNVIDVLVRAEFA